MEGLLGLQYEYVDLHTDRSWERMGLEPKQLGELHDHGAFDQGV